MDDRDLSEWRTAETWPEALLVALDRVDRLRARYGVSVGFRQAVYWRRPAHGFPGRWIISSHRRDGSRVGAHVPKRPAISR